MMATTVPMPIRTGAEIPPNTPDPPVLVGVAVAVRASVAVAVPLGWPVEPAAGVPGPDDPAVVVPATAPPSGLAAGLGDGLAAGGLATTSAGRLASGDALTMTGIGGAGNRWAVRICRPSWFSTSSTSFSG